MDFLNQMEPWFDEREADAVNAYLRSGGWVTEFSKTRDFEAAMAAFTGAKQCSIVSNGTVSLTLALLACGVGPGDEVLVPDYTMVATANAVQPTGAQVVFVDVERQSLCMDYDRMVAAVTPRTRAVMLVTLNGRAPARLPDFVSFCRSRKIALIEDAAQSLGSRFRGRHLGTFGDIGSFSFSAPKVITTGQGGALVTDNPALMERIQKLRDFGREKPGADRYLTMGWNAKFTDLQAVIGLVQMAKLPWRVERKKAIYARYLQQLAGVKWLEWIPTDLTQTSPWFIDVLVPADKREALIAHLKARQIGSRPFYPALHAEPVYARQERHPVAEDIAQRGLWLPSASKLTDAQIDAVCDAVRAFGG